MKLKSFESKRRGSHGGAGTGREEQTGDNKQQLLEGQEQGGSRVAMRRKQTDPASSLF
jgi:hypothetical protein